MLRAISLVNRWKRTIAKREKPEREDDSSRKAIQRWRKSFEKRTSPYFEQRPDYKNTKTNLITKNLETRKFDFCLLRVYECRARKTEKAE